MERFFDSRLAGYLNRAMRLAADMRLPSVVLDPAIGLYSKVMGVDMDGVEVPAAGFSSFDDFFVRRMSPEARPVSDEPDALASPSDGRLTAFGAIETGADPAFTIKGNTYSVSDLTGKKDDTVTFGGGGFAVVYLHPRDYHRVHAPVTAELTEVRHIPGARYPVAPWSEKRIDGIFGKNERLVFDFELAGGAALSLVMVAAYGVSNMEAILGPPINESCVTARSLEPGTTIERGAELGAFHLGSTVVLLWTAGAGGVDDFATPGKVRMGERIGTLSGQKS